MFLQMIPTNTHRKFCCFYLFPGSFSFKIFCYLLLFSFEKLPRKLVQYGKEETNSKKHYQMQNCSLNCFSDFNDISVNERRMVKTTSFPFHLLRLSRFLAPEIGTLKLKFFCFFLK